MGKDIVTTGKLNSIAEDLFIDLFCDVFGPESSSYISVQHPFVDIYGNRRYIDFAMESEGEKIAIEIDGETYHNPDRISSNKYYDDLLKQNSMINEDWKVYRWAYMQLKDQPEKMKDEMLTFIGEFPIFKELTEYLPKQKGKVIKLKDHQEDAIENLQNMRNKGETIALLYHATGERVIIVIGCINDLVSRVSGTLLKNIHALLRAIRYNCCKQCMRSRKSGWHIKL